MKVIVVGTNHAGTHAVTALTKHLDNVQVKTYDQNSNISFLGCGMALWIGDVIDSPEGLFYANQKSLTDLGSEVYLEHQITNIDFKGKTVDVKNLQTNETFKDEYDKLIIAVGSWPIKPPIPNIDLKNIAFVKLYQHAQIAHEIAQKDDVKKVAIVGGGYIGVELAESFKQKGKEVVLIEAEDHILNSYYDEMFSLEMKKTMEAAGITIATSEKVMNFEGNEQNEVTKVVTSKNSYDVDLVLLCIGFKPNTDFLKGSELETLGNGAILVDKNQQTSIKDVYAIGDCASIYDNALQKDRYIALATNAVRSGLVAGHHAAGVEIAMQGVQGSNAIHINGLTMCSTGICEKNALKEGIEVDSVTVTDTIKPKFITENDDVTLKIVWDKKTRRLLGAQMMSNADISLATHFFSLAIQENYTVDQIALTDLFFLPHFNQPVNFITKAGLLALEK